MNKYELNEVQTCTSFEIEHFLCPFLPLPNASSSIPLVLPATLKASKSPSKLTTLNKILSTFSFWYRPWSCPPNPRHTWSKSDRFLCQYFQKAWIWLAGHFSWHLSYLKILWVNLSPGSYSTLELFRRGEDGMYANWIQEYFEIILKLLLADLAVPCRRLWHHLE